MAGRGSRQRLSKDTRANTRTLPPSVFSDVKKMSEVERLPFSEAEIMEVSVPSLTGLKPSHISVVVMSLVSTAAIIAQNKAEVKD